MLDTVSELDYRYRLRNVEIYLSQREKSYFVDAGSNPAGPAMFSRGCILLDSSITVNATDIRITSIIG